jgi:amino acid adenylation domain-containing protein
MERVDFAQGVLNRYLGCIEGCLKVSLEPTGHNSDRPGAVAVPKFVFPTTFAQQRLWFLEQLQPGTTSYIVPWSLRIEGTLNITALEKSLHEIIRRHEILRTTFAWRDGMPVQVVGPPNFSLPVLDLSGLNRPEEKAEELGRAEARLPLDLEHGPLVRAKLLRLSSGLHILLLTTHHIIFDGWSRRILIQELSALYQAYLTGQPSALQTPKLQYADYAVWQRRHLQGATLEKQLSYWRNQLADAPATLDLPTDRPRPAIQSFSGAKLPIALSPDLTEKLNAFSRENGATLFMTLLAAFQALLARYSNQDDIAVGTPIANRNRAELEEIIGFFANTLVMRTRFDGELTFKDLVGRVKETALDAYAHQDVPFEKLVEELRPERSLSQNPLFQVMFSLQNAPRQAFVLSGLSLNLMDLGETSSKFDISVFLSETPDGVRGRFEFNTDLFNAETIERMIGHYEMLLMAAVERPTTPLSQISLLTATEREQILTDWNANQVEFPQTASLHRLFEDQAERTPDAVAVVVGRERTRYRELNERANQIAHHLMKSGVGPEVLVGVFLERSRQLLPAILGILKTGAAYVPLDPAYPRERLAAILDDAKAPIVVTQTSLAGQLAGATSKILNIESDALDREPRHNPKVPVRPENLAYVLFTSGSTGRPKGVAIEHRSAAVLVHWAKSLFSREELAGVLFSTSVCFDLSIFEMFVPLSAGGTVIVVQNALYLPSSEARNQVTLINTVPSAMAELVRANAVPSSIRTINLAGEALPQSLVSNLYSSTKVRKVYNLYGPTEDTTYSTYTLTPAGEPVTIGRPLPNTQAYVLDSSGNPQPVGVPGELYLAGAGLARGYFGRPEQTAERFLKNPFAKDAGARMYRTGDLCRWLPTGELEYLGRLDHQVKLRGFRIELGEIETVLSKHPKVRQCLVIAREDQPGTKRLVAYVVPAGGPVTDAELSEHLKQSLPEFMIPAAFVMLSEFPLTPNRKINRKALPVPDISNRASDKLQPRDDLEKSLARIWQEILSIEAIGVTDNFFDLGGHSLIAVRLMNEIKKLTGVSLPLTTLFQGATIERLANLIRGTSCVPQAVAHQIQAGGNHPPFFAAVLAGVNALGYVPLAKHLGTDQPFYTLQSPGPGPQATGRPYTAQEYESVASEYVRSMRSVQPIGPYYIGGTCEGARIAFEMTRILEAEGETVALLAVIDTWVLENTQDRRLWKIYYYYDQMRRLWRQPWKHRLAVVGRAIRNRLLWWTRAKSAPPKSEWIETYWPGEDFVPTQISGRVTVFKIPKQPFYYRPDPLLGWGSRTRSGVDIELVAHGKHTLLLREPYVREFAATLSKTLRRIRPEPPQPVTRVELESADAAAVSR